MQLLKTESVLFLLTLLSPLAAQAETKETCAFKLSCENGGHKFTLNFQSKSGDCAEDDMEATFTSGGQTIPLGLKPAWHSYTSHILKTPPSICKGEGQQSGFAAYSLGSKEALLFLKHSGRPGYDHVTAVLLDTDRGKILDSKQLGDSKNSQVAVLKNEEGFKLRLIRDSLSFHEEVNCDCDAPYVDDWLQVAVTKGKISAGWLVK